MPSNNATPFSTPAGPDPRAALFNPSNMMKAETNAIIFPALAQAIAAMGAHEVPADFSERRRDGIARRLLILTLFEDSYAKHGVAWLHGAMELVADFGAIVAAYEGGEALV